MPLNDEEFKNEKHIEAQIRHFASSFADIAEATVIGLLKKLINIRNREWKDKIESHALSNTEAQEMADLETIRSFWYDALRELNREYLKMKPPTQYIHNPGYNLVFAQGHKQLICEKLVVLDKELERFDPEEVAKFREYEFYHMLLPTYKHANKGIQYFLDHWWKNYSKPNPTKGALVSIRRDRNPQSKSKGSEGGKKGGNA